MDFGQAHGNAMQKTGRVCAYCGSNSDLTNEHLFRVFLQLIIPTPTSSREWVARPDAAEVPPAPGRIDLLDVSKLIGFNMGYVVSLNSYLFHIFKEVDTVPPRIRKLVLKNLLKHM